MFDKARLRGKSLPASMLSDCKYRNFCQKKQKQAEKVERLRRHSTCDSLKTNPLSRNAIVQLLTAAITFKHRQHLVSGAVEDAVDGVLASDVLDLAAAEVEMLS